MRVDVDRIMTIKRTAAALGVSAVLTISTALADYPERAIAMVIPYGASGATDISARAIADPLGDAVGKPLIMANITGAGGATGSDGLCHSVGVQNDNQQ